MSDWPKLTLKIAPPIEVMEATPVDALARDPGWQFEPKWDGFRCIAFRSGTEVALQSKAGKPLTRYFPEVVAHLLAIKAKHFVLDGELTIPADGGLDFDALLQRMHPAATRIARLAKDTPAEYYVFDLLLDQHGKSLLDAPLSERRKKLEAFAAKISAKASGIHLSPATTDRAVIDAWAKNLRGKGIDGVIAKRLDLPYGSGHRAAMQKMKWRRTADCVVGGFRYGSGSKLVGSLLLGLYDHEGDLNHVGYCSNLSHLDVPALTKKLERLRKEPGFTGKAPGGPSRWSTERSGEWEPLSPKIVVEVQYDHVSGERFRHGTKLLRFRLDKAARQCSLQQIVP